MLKTTVELINYLKQNKTSYAIVDSYVNCIMKFGSKNDSDILFDYYLSNPFNFKSSYLLPLFKKFGDKLYAEKLFKIYIGNPKMVEESRPEILKILGDLKNDSIKDILKQYAFGDKGDYYLSRSGVLGLLNFDCKEYEELIESEIIKCYNKSLFPEYVPALVCKIENKEKFLEELFVLGNEYASTDCNAGIVLGFSLCGEIGRKYFMDALNNPHWEVDSSGTGTIWATYEGIKNLNISFKELYLNIKKETDNDKIEHLLSVLFALLERRMRDYDDEHLERFTELYKILFEWDNENTSNNLIDLASKVDKAEPAYVLEKMLELKITEELILRTC